MIRNSHHIKTIIGIIASFITAIILVVFALYKFQPAVYYFIMSDTLNLISSPNKEVMQETAHSLYDEEIIKRYSIPDQLGEKSSEERTEQKTVQYDEEESKQKESLSSPHYIKKDKLNNRPLLAIIVDDGGYKVDFANRLANLDIPLTWAILPYESNAKAFASIASEHDIPFLVHYPMQAEMDKRAATNAIGKDMSSGEIRAKISTAFSILPAAVGLNNHRGSLATSDRQLMQPVIDEVKSRDKIFLDSRTSSKSVAYAIAKEAKMKTFQNNGFLDGESDEKSIESNFNKIVEKAIKSGSAVVICHFRPNTVSFLEKLNMKKEALPVKLVTISQLAEMMYDKQSIIE